MKPGGLRPADYVPRVHDQRLSHMLDAFDALEVAGPMWCGKTWSSLAAITALGR